MNVGTNDFSGIHPASPFRNDYSCNFPRSVAENFRRFCAAEVAASGLRPTRRTELKKPAAGVPARAFEFLRDDEDMPVICPTCQMSCCGCRFTRRRFYSNP
jgi:hypothetical protein